MYGCVFYNVRGGDSYFVTDPSQAQDDRVGGVYGGVVYNVLVGDSYIVTDSLVAMRPQNDKKEWVCMGALFSRCGVVTPAP